MKKLFLVLSCSCCLFSFAANADANNYSNLSPEEQFAYKLKENEAELSSKAESGDLQAKLDLLVSYATFGEVKDFKDIYEELLNQEVEGAIIVVTQYLHNSHDPEFSPIIDITKKYYEKTENKAVGQYLASMYVCSGKIADGVALFNQNKDFELYSSLVFAKALLSHGVKSHISMAEEILTNAIEHGDESAASTLGMAYYEKVDKQKGLDFLKLHADKNNVGAAKMLCLIHLGRESLFSESELLKYADIAYHEDGAKVISITLNESDMGQYLEVKRDDKSMHLEGVRI